MRPDPAAPPSLKSILKNHYAAHFALIGTLVPPLLWMAASRLGFLVSKRGRVDVSASDLSSYLPWALGVAALSGRPPAPPADDPSALMDRPGAAEDRIRSKPHSYHAPSGETRRPDPLARPALVSWAPTVRGRARQARKPSTSRP